MKVPSISKFQWHSFTITSSSSADDQTMSVIIKDEGWWTSSLYHLISSQLDSNPNKMKSIPVAIEGPYGPASLDFLRYDSLLMVAGGIGITPFLSILQEIDCARGNGRNRLPKKVQLIYTMKKSEDISLLNPILPLLLNQMPQQLHLKLKLFVTQEDRPGVTMPELLNQFSHVETVNFDTKCSNYPTQGPERFASMAAIVGFSSIKFLVFVVCLNRVFLEPDNKSSKHKSPSSVTDLLLLCSFALAITFGSLVAVVLRWKKLRKEFTPIPQKQGKVMKSNSMELRTGSLEEHEICFRTRPIFQDIFAKFPNETGGSDIGVLVCGPETMKESVASLCKLSSQGLKIGVGEKKPYFTFHSLNFTL